MPEKDYSHRDITDKLGLKPGFAVRVTGKGNKALLVRIREKIGRKLVSSGALANVILYLPGWHGWDTRTLCGRQI